MEEAVIPTVVERVQDINGKVKSISAELTPDRIVIDMPRFSMDKCIERPGIIPAE